MLQSYISYVKLKTTTLVFNAPRAAIIKYFTYKVFHAILMIILNPQDYRLYKASFQSSFPVVKMFILYLMIINEKQQRRSLEIIEEVISPRSVSDVSDKSAGDQQDDRPLLGQNKQVIEIVHMVEEV